MKTTEKELIKLKEVADPVIKYLNDNYHPHVKMIITPTSVELLEECMACPNIMDHVKD